MVVQKYGGSSVADVPRIQAVARRVVETVKSGHQVAVVVSAMGNTTNELLALAHSVSSSPGRRELDLLVSVGERVSMTLLAMAIEDLGVPAASFTGSQSGIITDENHVAAKVLEVRPQRVRQALDEGKVAIVAGFQGVSRMREVTTLGRGGSDTTAVVLSAALGADYCEICSDVEGVFSADPRTVPNAKKLESLSLDAAGALANAGAKVLLAEAVEKAQELGVVLHAVSAQQPTGSGTSLPPGPTPDGVVAIASDQSVAWVWVQNSNLKDLAVLQGAVRASWSSNGGVAALVDTKNLHDERPSSLVFREDIATVSVVGKAVVEDPLVLDKALAVIQSSIPEGTLVHWFCGRDVLRAVIPLASVQEAERALHQALLPA